MKLLRNCSGDSATKRGVWGGWIVQGRRQSCGPRTKLKARQHELNSTCSDKQSMYSNQHSEIYSKWLVPMNCTVTTRSICTRLSCRHWNWTTDKRPNERVSCCSMERDGKCMIWLRTAAKLLIGAGEPAIGDASTAALNAPLAFHLVTLMSDAWSLRNKSLATDIVHDNIKINN